MMEIVWDDILKGRRSPEDLIEGDIRCTHK